jgi:hypothetical protein
MELADVDISTRPDKLAVPLLNVVFNLPRVVRPIRVLYPANAGLLPIAEVA